MKFRTEYHPSPVDRGVLTPERPMVLMGSCFSDNIGTRATQAGWEVYVNPCGTLFNPFSIARVVRLACTQDRQDMERRLFEHDGRWRSWDFSTLFSAPERRDCNERCCEALGRLREGLARAQAIIVTLGTAWIYRLADGEAVANCHKMPDRNFMRSLGSVEEITDALTRLSDNVRRFNPDIRIIFTLSPVRHLRDGMAGNSLSKSTLRLSIAEMEKRGCLYFPAFEIMTDDLRDYRFYADDLLHPSQAGVEYIWEKFTAQYLDEEGFRLLAKKEAEARRTRHRPLL
ncbi:MAG: GSCFA domain-containing protein [Muribaculaceae bacterium]|nr:GSCFA domain-containing protein [Muribaculaceae bacterium]